jgi:predicted acylesterase/phospholipase RssA
LQPRQRSTLLLACILVVSACAGSRPKPDMSECIGPLSRGARTVAVLPSDPLQETTISDLRNRKPRGDSTGDFDMLCLSGGGRSGAWGAGVLNGWIDAAPDSFPKFDIVTGVSTGALMATHAFLGEPSDIYKIRDAYTQIPGERLIETHSTLRGVLGNGLTSLKPLRRTLPSFLTREDIDRVAAVEDRSLYVGTVDLDCGDLIIWDMKKLARRGDYCRYWDVVVASCVAPGFTEPVFIDGKMHADGGTRQQIFIPPLLRTALRNYFASRVGESRVAATADKPAGTVYAIVNGGLGVYPHVVENSFIPIALRGTEVLMDEAEIAALRFIECYATHSRPTGLAPPEDELLQHAGKLRFRMSFVPEESRRDVQTLDFDLNERRRLYAAGYDWARARPKPNHNWPTYVPASPVRTKP